MHEVTCHRVEEHRIARALEDIWSRSFAQWHGVRYGDGLLNELLILADDLVDHVAACSTQDPTLSGASEQLALRTAAECALGVLTIGCFPGGDFGVPFPLIDEELTSEDMDLTDAVDLAPTARTWVDAFRLCVVSGVLGEWKRAIGLVMRKDYAPAIHKGLPYSRLTSVSDPAELVEMDVLCRYLTPSPGHLPRDWPVVTVRKPDGDERREAARCLDALSALTPDQLLLRVLLEDDQPAFEQALAGRLVQHREGASADAAPRSLLPLGALAPAALAVQVHGWQLHLRSGYLPHGLLHALDKAPQARS
ncbi:immunity 49 family protein [Streptomyces sp. ACA25]|uniref:immunity 49 family protein n=1 Tax=Streptomyces sp. ACA25 TaxID=3022596 RepID=UPI002307B8E6|nr:immunity 49 family protein [Streptomyces sp. ACA25]MDB1088753.1 immunity 49 family protein [Streptomyces sp. ACA25]